MRFAWLIAAGLALSGCFFGDIDFVGRSCDANQQCPDGLTCDPATRTCANSAHDLGATDASPINCVDPADAGASYIIYRLPSGAGINLTSALCTEPFWSTVPPIAFLSPNPTNNTQTCRMVWEPGQPDVIFGCCEVMDSDVRASYTAMDSAVYLDDGIEYLLKANLDLDFDATTSKIQINVQGAYADRNFPDGGQNTLYVADVVAVAKVNGTINDDKPDTGYSIKWRANVGFPVMPPQLGKCDFLVSDLDLDGGTEVRSTWVAYGTNDNRPTDWGTCMLSCSPP